MKTQKAIESAKGETAGRNIRILLYLGVNLIIVVCLIAQGVFHETASAFPRIMLQMYTKFPLTFSEQ